jgi:hypothetical protein
MVEKVPPLPSIMDYISTAVMLEVQITNLASLKAAIGYKVKVMPFAVPVFSLLDSNGVHRFPVGASPVSGGGDVFKTQIHSAGLGADPIYSLYPGVTNSGNAGVGSPYNVNAGSGGVYLRSKTVIVTSGATGAVVSTKLLDAQAGAKNVIVEMSAIGWITSSLLPAVAQLTISDQPVDNATLPIGPSVTSIFGPFYQNTLNTEVDVACGAGLSSPNSTFIITIRYRVG